ncbi:MAG: hypothetical protein GXO44_00610 [Deferribacteres bacterium]|nr:hypothetical protein [Deferribacteres bacterium]
MVEKKLTIESVYLLVGFLGLLSSIMVMFASYTERKFFQLMSAIYQKWHGELKELVIGVDEYKNRMNRVDEMLPEFKPTRFMLTAANVSVVLGILIYSYSLLAVVKGWQPQLFLLKLFMASAFLFIFAGFAAYFVNRRLLSSANKVKELLEEIYGKV